MLETETAGLLRRFLSLVVSIRSSLYSKLLNRQIDSLLFQEGNSQVEAATSNLPKMRKGIAPT
jgi:hypothetical protein